MRKDSARLFFVVSGEHNELPRAEVEAILGAESIPFRLAYTCPKIILIDGPIGALDAVARRSLMMESCGTVIAESHAEKAEIENVVRDSILSEVLEQGDSFVVRSLRVPGSDLEIRRDKLERELGATILGIAEGHKVSLKNADKTLLGILAPDRFIFGALAARRRRGEIHARRPRRRPFFHPSTMQPKLARCMVNLARARPGQTLLDPFCGAGSHLIEAALIGCKAVGLDVDRRMIRGASRNLLSLGVEGGALVHADARHIPLTGLDSIATDPPYGRASSTAGLNTEDLLLSFLEDARGVLTRGRFACVAVPSSLDMASMCECCEFSVVESYKVYVHRSLTRQIFVLKHES
ncbi:MAG: methyltransferase domain-containing protein [archaeon]